jgi:hypothetical protein
VVRKSLNLEGEFADGVLENRNPRGKARHEKPRASATACGIRPLRHSNERFRIVWRRPRVRRDTTLEGVEL